MAIYNFKRETKVYLVRENLQYTLDVYPDITFSQTFNETSVPVKTLHSQFNMFEDAVITKANPANFSFTIPFLEESDLDIILEQLLDYDTTSTEAVIKSVDLYVESNSEVYKLEKAVVETGVFNIAREGIFLLSVSGTARKLSKFTETIPGVAQARSSTRSFIIPSAFGVRLGTTDMDHISGVSLELKNDVQWIDFATLQNSLAVNDASGTLFPEAFVVASRTLSGNVQQYITNTTNDKVSSWEIGESLSIRIGNINSNWLMDISLPSIVYTNRIDPQELFMQSYDFRMTSTTSDLSQIIKHMTVSGPLSQFEDIWSAI